MSNEYKTFDRHWYTLANPRLSITVSVSEDGDWVIIPRKNDFNDSEIVDYILYDRRTDGDEYGPFTTPAQCKHEVAIIDPKE